MESVAGPDDNALLSVGYAMYVDACDRSPGNQFLAMADLYDGLYVFARLDSVLRRVSGRQVSGLWNDITVRLR